MDYPTAPQAGADPAMPAADDQQKMIVREKPVLDKGVVDLIKGWHKKLEDAEDYWLGTFARMRGNAKFARGRQWAAQSDDDDRYIANITLRHINQRVANIYAKNPKVRALKRPKLYAKAWDGSPQMLEAAVQAVAILSTPGAAEGAAAQGVRPQMDAQTAQAVVTEAQEAHSKKQLYDRMGRTLELVAQYSLDEPIPKFKPQAKQLVRRTLTTGCGYVKLGYQRIMEYDAGTLDARIGDATDQLEQIKLLAADVHDKTVTEDSPQAAELKSLIEQLQKQKEMVLREGLVFGFPKSWNIVTDPAIVQLKGFIGAGWVAEKYVFTVDQVKKLFKVDLGKDYTAHTATGSKGDKRFKDKKFCAVYEVYDLVGRQCFTVCLGYEGWLEAPDEPDVALEQFHPYYVLSFNDIEPDADDDNIYPPSDVDLIRPMQVEYNRAREGKRVHRQAQRPAMVSNKGVFDEETKKKFASHADHELIETNLSKQDDINKALQVKPTIPIDEKLYEVESIFADTLRVAGDQSANLGPTSGGTATESSIAENSRVTSIQSNIDDLDEFLTDIMRGAGQVLLLEMSPQVVMEIAGPGAVWPQFSRTETARELCLEIRAGSSGKPNRQARLQAVEKVAPFLLQTPGVKPLKLAEFMLNEIDEGIEIDEFLDESLPSITAMNAQAKPNLAPMPGNTAQGPQGAMNAPQPGGTGAEEQNMHPAPNVTAGGGAPHPKPPPLLTTR